MLDRIIYLIVRLLASTYRFREHGRENITEAIEKNQRPNYLLGLWHQNLFPGIMAQKKKSFVVIVSRSKDASPVAYTCQKLGHRICRGSSRSKDGRNKGGLAALKEMVHALQKGLPGAVTVDGPKGPPHQPKKGIFAMAQQASLPIIPYAPLPQSYWEFKSWDRFRLPKPFSLIHVHYGKAIFIQDRNDDSKKEKELSDFSPYQERLKEALNNFQSSFPKEVSKDNDQR